VYWTDDDPVVTVSNEHRAAAQTGRPGFGNRAPVLSGKALTVAKVAVGAGVAWALYRALGTPQ